MKIKILELLLFLLFMLIFSLIFFTVFDTFSVTRLGSYGAIMTAWLLFAGACYSTPKVRRGVIYGYPKIAVVWCYFLLELVAGILFIIFDSAPWLALLTQAALLAFALGVYILLLLSEEHSINADRRDDGNIAFIKNAASQLQNLPAQAPNAELRRKLLDLRDIVTASPVDSDPAVRHLESELVRRIAEIRQSLQAGVLPAAAVDAALAVIAERNRTLRLHQR